MLIYNYVLQTCHIIPPIGKVFDLSCLQDDRTVPGVTAGTICSHESRAEMHRSDFGKQTPHKSITSVTNKFHEVLA